MDGPHVTVRNRPSRCESPAIPLVLSLNDHLSHGPDRDRGPHRGLRPTRPEGPTWTCTVAEIARLIRPSRAGLRFYSSLRVPASQAKTRDSLPHRRLTPPGLAPSANFLPCGKRCQEVPHHPIPVQPAEISLPVSAARSSAELSHLYPALWSSSAVFTFIVPPSHRRRHIVSRGHTAGNAQIMPRQPCHTKAARCSAITRLPTTLPSQSSS